MIDVENDQLISLSQAARVANPGHPPHLATLHRWVSHGVAHGVKLESLKIGGLRFTSREAVQRFLGALNEPNAIAEPVSKAAVRAGKRLQAKGA